MNKNDNNLNVSLSKFIASNNKGFKMNMMYLGIAMGIMLQVIAIIIDIVVKRVDFNVVHILALYSDNPIHWIILTAPFFLGSFFFFMGKLVSERELRLEEQANRDKKQFHLLESFITNLESGNFNTDISEDFENRVVAQQLSRFKDKLTTGKVAEERRAWESQGLAAFGELLRQSQEHVALSEAVIRFLVKHVDCNQGSVFIISEDDKENPKLNITACYAFDRKKFVSKSVSVGEGLVGQCFLERNTIILCDVPKDYIKITSGLGDATPAFVAIIPLKINDHVNGVLEVASFKKLEQYKINFLEKACEAFASVIQSGRTNQNVKVLLEESQQQTEELRAQEEELRQNIEEMQAIQEQMARQLRENVDMKNRLEAREHVLGKTTILSEADLYGTITYVNSKFCEVSQYRSEELVGRGHNFVRHPDMPKELFKLMWSTIKKGETFRGILKNMKKDGTHYWVDATIVPVIENNKIVKYIGARYHILDDNMALKMYNEQIKRLGVALEALPMWE